MIFKLTQTRPILVLFISIVLSSCGGEGGGGGTNSDTTFESIATDNSVRNPPVGASYIDPVFGKKITRITDRINQQDTPLVDKNGKRISRGNAHPYPKTQAWNSDMSILRMHYRLYNAKTMQELTITNGSNNLSKLYNINGALSEIKWSNTDPNVFYGISGDQFKKGTINAARTDIKHDLVKDFGDANGAVYDKFTLGKYEGNIDFSDKYVVFAARKKGKKYLTAIVYDITLDKIKKVKDFPHAEWPDEGQVFDWATASPLGKHILISSGGKIDQYNMDLVFIRTLAERAGHGDIGIDQNGDEAYVQFEYREYNGIWIYRLKDGHHIRLLPDKYNGGHVSCRNYYRYGWCYVSTNAAGNREVFAVKLDYSGPDNHIVNRYAQTHTTGQYSMGNVSPDGTKIIFRSNWNDANINWYDVDTYLVE